LLCKILVLSTSLILIRPIFGKFFCVLTPNLGTTYEGFNDTKCDTICERTRTSYFDQKLAAMPARSQIGLLKLRRDAYSFFTFRCNEATTSAPQKSDRLAILGIQWVARRVNSKGSLKPRAHILKGQSQVPYISRFPVSGTMLVFEQASL
jgi:hypothetical protein